VVRGELVNTNSSWLAERLTERGYIVSEHVSVGDDSKHIRETLLRLAREHEIIVCTGGLGPTTDDVTTQAVADLQGVRLVEDERSLAHITELMRSRGREMAESNKKQAWFPEGATVLDNSHGTAPGFATKIAVSDVYFLPGVPHEMKAMFAGTVAPRLEPRTHQLQIKLNTFGLFESEVNDRLRDIEDRFDVKLGYRAHFPTIEVKVLVSGSDPKSLESRARRASKAVCERLGTEVVFSEGNVTLSQAVGHLLTERSLKLGLAESCTGGLVSELITESPGSSEYFSGAVVSYSNQVKERVLGVAAET
jgi:nicotinamide-nucleotide amidase